MASAEIIEVYSNTGGQASKSTPPGAVAKFAAAGKAVPKKDLALQAIAYGNVYVARVAMGADPQQTLRALREAESYRGTSLVLAYSHCIAHGIEKDGMPLRNGMDQQYRAVATGYWPLVRYDLVLRDAGRNPFLLDSHRPRLPLSDYTGRELRYRILARTNPEAAERLSKLAEQQVSQRWATYEEMAARSPEWFTGQRRRRPGQHRERGEQPMNLSSSYLGLDLRNPLVASAGPMTQTADRIERPGRGRHRQLRRGHQLPDRPGRQPLAPPVPRPGSAGRETRHSGDRQPQRQHPRRVDRLRPCHAGRGRRARSS